MMQKYIKIVILQEELLELGFEYVSENKGSVDEYIFLHKMRIYSKKYDDYIYISFFKDFVHCYVQNCRNIYYNSNSFHSDVIARVKELL